MQKIKTTGQKMNSITTSFSNSSQNISYATLGVAAVALSTLTSIAFIIFTKIRLDAANKRLGKLENKVTQLMQRISTTEGLQRKHNQALIDTGELLGEHRQALIDREKLLNQHHQTLVRLNNETPRLDNHLTIVERFSHLALRSILPRSTNNENFCKLLDCFCNNTTKTPHSIPYMRIPPIDPSVDNSTYRNFTISDLEIDIENQIMYLDIIQGSPVSQEVKIVLKFEQTENILFEEPKT